MPFQRRLIAAAAAAIATTPAAAETQDPVVVTATRTAETADSTLAPVTVLTREDIEQAQPADLPDLLANRAGIQMRQYGGPGKPASFYLRGTNSGHTLFLVDGQRAGSATDGGAAIQDIPVHLIERVEVVRGPRASLYGADAIGGVINVITRKGDGGYVRAGGGRYNTRELAAGYGVDNGSSQFRLNVSHKRSEGFDAQEGGHPDDDRYENRSLNLRGGHDFGPVAIRANYYRAESESEYDVLSDPVASDPRREAVRETGRAEILLRPGDGWQSRLSLGQTRDDGEEYAYNQRTDRYATRRTTAHWQNDFTLTTRQMVTAGLDYYVDDVSAGSQDYDETERYNRAGYLQYQWMGRRLDIQASGRWDDNEAYGENTTGQAAIGWRINDTARLVASHGTAFKAPTFNDLYFPGSGNPDLEPEESRTSDLGIRLNRGGTRVAITAFRTEVDDLIEWQFANGQFSPANVNEARIRGVETEVGLTGDDWDLDLAVTSLDTENEDTGNSLDRRADLTWRLDGERRVGDWRFGGSLEHQGARRDGGAALGAYTLATVRAGWQVSESLQLRGRVENLTDTDYATAKDFSGNDYNTAGKSAYGEVVWRLR